MTRGCSCRCIAEGAFGDNGLPYLYFIVLKFRNATGPATASIPQSRRHRRATAPKLEIRPLDKGHVLDIEILAKRRQGGENFLGGNPQ
jgi:hypothetical protein